MEREKAILSQRDRSYWLFVKQKAFEERLDLVTLWRNYDVYNPLNTLVHVYQWHRSSVDRDVLVSHRRSWSLPMLWCEGQASYLPLQMWLWRSDDKGRGVERKGEMMSKCTVQTPHAFAPNHAILSLSLKRSSLGRLSTSTLYFGRQHKRWENTGVVDWRSTNKKEEKQRDFGISAAAARNEPERIPIGLIKFSKMLHLRATTNIFIARFKNVDPFPDNNSQWWFWCIHGNCSASPISSCHSWLVCGRRIEMRIRGRSTTSRQFTIFSPRMSFFFSSLLILLRPFFIPSNTSAIQWDLIEDILHCLGSQDFTCPQGPRYWTTFTLVSRDTWCTLFSAVPRFPSCNSDSSTFSLSLSIGRWIEHCDGGLYWRERVTSVVFRFSSALAAFAER